MSSGYNRVSSLALHFFTVLWFLSNSSQASIESTKRYNPDCISVSDVNEDHWEFLQEIGKDEYTKKLRVQSGDQRMMEGLTLAELNHPMIEKLHIYNSTDPEIIAEYDKFTSGPKVDEEICTKQLTQMVALLEDLARINELKKQSLPSPKLNESHIRLARVIDSYGRYLSGSQQLRYAAFGSHEQCLKTQLQLDHQHPTDLVTTRVCIASLHRCSARTNQREKVSAKDLLPKTSICIPSSCHSKSLKNSDIKRLIQKLIDSQFKLPRSVYVDPHREVLEIFCLNDDNESYLDIPLTGKLTLAGLILWIVIIFLLNVLQVEKWAGKNWNWLKTLAECVHLRTILESFLAYDKVDNYKDDNKRLVATGDRTLIKQRRVNLFALNFVKVSGTMIVVFCHAFMVMTVTSTDMIEVYKAIEYDYKTLLILSLNMVVDTFFIISGMLSAYLTAKKLEKFDRRKIKFFSASLFIILSRYLRLVPLFFLGFLIKKYILMYIGSGPMWDHGFNSNTLFGKCKSDTWLSSFTPMLFDWQSSMEQCIGQGWSLRGEIFAMLVTTPLIILMVKSPKWAVLLAALIGFIANILLFQAVDHLDEIYGGKLSRFEAIPIIRSVINDMTLYNRSHFRIGTVLLGLVAGYYIYWYDNGWIKEWPHWFRRYASKLAILSIINSLCATAYIRPMLKRNEVQTPHLYAHLTVTNRLFWGISNAIVLTRVVTDWRDYYIIKLFNGRFLQTLGKLSYAILLLHLDLNVIDFYNKMIRTNYSYSRNLTNAAAVYMQSAFLGLFVHLLIECPLDNLCKVLLNSKMDANQSDSIQKQEHATSTSISKKE